MEWCRLYARLPGDRAILAAGERAAWLFVIGLCYCAEEESDGFIPKEQLSRFGLTAAQRRAAALVRHGLWVPVEGGWQVRRWRDRQPTVERLTHTRDQAKRRQARFREGMRNGVTATVTHAVTNAVINPVTDDVTNDDTNGVTHADDNGVSHDSRVEKKRKLVTWGGGSSGKLTRDTETSPPQKSTQTTTTSPHRCLAHRSLPADEPGPNCRHCREARLAAEHAQSRARRQHDDAARRCGLCTADGYRLDTLGRTPTPEPCDHRPRRNVEPDDDGSAELQRLRTFAETVACPQCPARERQPCVNPDTDEPLIRAPAHHQRIKTAQERHPDE